MLKNESFLDKVRSFDVYRKLPKDYLEPTCIGALCNLFIT